MTAFIVIASIISFFILVLSICVKLKMYYVNNSLKVSVSWFFINIPLYPREKKEKKPIKKEVKEEKPSDENPEEKKNPIDLLKKFYNDMGKDGIVKILSDIADIVGSFGNTAKKHIVFEKLFLNIVVSSGHDAASTAEMYGKYCQKIFPSFGFICNNCPVRKYDCEITPDFLGSFPSADFETVIHIRPIFFINGAIVFAVRFLVRVFPKLKPYIFPKKQKNKALAESAEAANN
ncbi:MAG: hypothetical protein ACTTIO_03450 [Candidatus Fimenecus sp.]